MSWQLRALTPALRLVVRRFLARVDTPQNVRQAFARMARLYPFRPAHIRHLTRPGGLHWISAGPCAPRQVILYFHGGGYIAGSPYTHKAMLARLSGLAGVEICAPRYPLAPEAPAPAAFEAALAAYRGLLSIGYDPRQIVLGGDSAGGGLALALLAKLCQDGCPPAGLFAFSPWCDLSLTGGSLRENAVSDMILPAERVEELAGYVLPEGPTRDPRVSPLFAAFPNCPPVQIHYSESEILRDDALRMSQRLAGFGADMSFCVEQDAPHVWHLFDGCLPEARAGLACAAEFAQTCLGLIKRNPSASAM